MGQHPSVTFMHAPRPRIIENLLILLDGFDSASKTITSLKKNAAFDFRCNFQPCYSSSNHHMLALFLFDSLSSQQQSIELSAQR